MTKPSAHAVKQKFMKHDGPGPRGATLLVTYVGAATYFVSLTTGGFWDVILALLKALVWPAFLVYHLLQFLGV